MCTYAFLNNAGTAGVIIVSILIFNDSTENIGQIFEWLFYIFLPNYCYSQSLQNVYINYETMKACDDVKNSFGQYFDVYCALIGTVNQTNPCCRSESVASSCLNNTYLTVTEII